MLRLAMGGLTGAALLGLACTRVNPAYLGDGSDGSEGAGGSSTADDRGGPGTVDESEGSATKGTGSATSVGDTSDSQTTNVDTSGEPGCVSNGAPCPEHSQCVDTGGSPACVCDRGYQEDDGVCVIEPGLDPLLWRLDCLAESNFCTSADVCAVALPDTEHAVMVEDSATLVGDDTILYDVTLRLRGVVEPKAYAGGVTTGRWNEGGEPISDGWNVAILRIEDPPREVFVNAGPGGARYCYGLDEEHTVLVRGGAAVEIQVIDPNNCAMTNLDAPLPEGEPIAFDGIDDPPQPHDGQFLYVEAVEILPTGG